MEFLSKLFTGNENRYQKIKKKAKIEPCAAFLYKDDVRHLTSFNNMKNINGKMPVGSINRCDKKFLLCLFCYN
jgi:hypothetical protein